MNNNYSFEPMTGQPINQQQPSNTNIYQQPVQPTSEPPKKNNKVFIIIAVLAVIAIVVGIVLFTSQNKENAKNNNSNTNSEVENNNGSNETQEDTSSNVEEDFDNSNEENNSFLSIKEKWTKTDYDENGDFLFKIEDVFTISGRGTVVTGTVERGTIHLNDEVQVIGLDNEIITTTVTGVEVFRKDQDFATIGDNPGLLLQGVERDQVQRGQVVAKPNSIAAHTKFDADIHILSEEEGGSRKTSFTDGFQPQFNFCATDITGTIKFPEDLKIVNPGDEVSFSVNLNSSVAMEIGTVFTIRENMKTIGFGRVTKVY